MSQQQQYPYLSPQHLQNWHGNNAVADTAFTGVATSPPQSSSNLTATISPMHRSPHSGKDFDPHLKAPFTMCISGMTQSGKSTLVKQILIRRNEIIKTPDESPIASVTYCYTEWQAALFAELKNNVFGIQFHLGLPDQYHDGTDRPSIVVLDDLMHEAAKKDIGAAFTRTSHHRNVSLIILVQNFFHKNMREITSNCHYIVLMKNPRDSGFVACLGRQMNGNQKNEAMDRAYKDTMMKPYGHLFIDLTQTQNDKLRIRDNVFPENCKVYIDNGYLLVVKQDDYKRFLNDKELKQATGGIPTAQSTSVQDILDSSKADELKTIMIQDILRRLADDQRRAKEPLKVEVIPNDVQLQPIQAPKEEFDSSNLSKLGGQMLSFFIKNGVKVENGEVYLNESKMTRIAFQDWIHKLADGRHKIVPSEFPMGIAKFLQEKNYSMTKIPAAHHVLFESEQTGKGRKQKKIDFIWEQPFKW